MEAGPRSASGLGSDSDSELRREHERDETRATGTALGVVGVCAAATPHTARATVFRVHGYFVYLRGPSPRASSALPRSGRLSVFCISYRYFLVRFLAENFI